MGSLTRPRFIGPPEGGGSAPKAQLLQTLVFLLLVPDVLAYHVFIATHCRYEVPSRPEMLPYKIALALSIHPGQMDRALALDIATTCDTAYFGGIESIICT